MNLDDEARSQLLNELKQNIEVQHMLRKMVEDRLGFDPVAARRRKRRRELYRARKEKQRSA